MKRFLILLCIYLAIVTTLLITHFNLDNPGYVLISLGQYTIEMSFFTLITFAFMSVAVLHLGKKILASLSSRLIIFGRFFQFRKNKALNAQKEAIISYLIDDPSSANKLATTHAELQESPEIAYLIAAKTANSLEQKQQFLSKACDVNSYINHYSDYFNAFFQFQEGEYSNTIELLENKKSPTYSEQYLLGLAYKHNLQPELYFDVLEKLNKKYKLNDYENLRTEALEGVFEHGLFADYKSLTAFWNKLTQAEKLDTEMFDGYVSRLFNIAPKEAWRLIKERISSQSDDKNLPLLLMSFPWEKEPAEKMCVFLEKLCHKQNQNEMLLLALAHFLILQGEYEKARSYLQDSINIQSNAQSYQQLGLAEASLGLYKQACESLLKAKQ